MTKREIHISKFLSLVLRHKPETIGVRLEDGGWIEVETLLNACAAHQFPLTREELRAVVTGNDKQRFAFSDNGLKLRASQGHSVDVELGYAPTPPPEVLYHGTAERFLESILEKGLLKGERQHVHLSAEVETAKKVGLRHGKPVVLTVAAAKLSREGVLFYLSDNGVWLVDAVPTAYLSVT